MHPATGYCIPMSLWLTCTANRPPRGAFCPSDAARWVLTGGRPRGSGWKPLTAVTLLTGRGRLTSVNFFLCATSPLGCRARTGRTTGTDRTPRRIRALSRDSHCFRLNTWRLGPSRNCPIRPLKQRRLVQIALHLRKSVLIDSQAGGVRNLQAPCAAGIPVNPAIESGCRERLRCYCGAGPTQAGDIVDVYFAPNLDVDGRRTAGAVPFRERTHGRSRDNGEERGLPPSLIALIAFSHLLLRKGPRLRRIGLAAQLRSLRSIHLSLDYNLMLLWCRLNLRKNLHFRRYRIASTQYLK